MLNKCKELLLERGINPASSIEYEVNGSTHNLTLEWIISAFLKTEKKELFIDMFEKILKDSDSNVEAFFEQMGQLVLMSSLSENGVEEVKC